VVDEDEKEDEDNGKDLRTIGQGQMVNTSADDADSMVDDQPTVLRGLGQKMREHTTRRQPPAHTPMPQTLEPCPRPQTRLAIHATIRWIGFWGL
jgi:hypothetical protein